MSETDKEPAAKAETLGTYLGQRKLHIMKMIPGGSLTAEKLIASAVMSTKKVGALARCDFESVFLAVMDAAELGLTVHWGPRGDAALVPYGKKCQLIVGYRGYVKLFLRSGLVRQVAADVCREHDFFTYYMDSRGVHFKWRPLEDEAVRGEVVRYFCAAWGESGCHVARLTREKAERIRDDVLAKIKSDDYKTREQKIAESPHTLWETEMGIKASVRQMAKLLPCENVENAQEIEEKHEREVGGQRLDLATERFTAPALPDPKARIQEVIEPSEEPAPVSARVEREEVRPSEPPAPAEPEPRPEPRTPAGTTPLHRMEALFVAQGKVSAKEFGELIKLIDPALRETWVAKYNERNGRGGQR